MERAKAVAVKLLEHFGLTVKPIPEDNKNPRADLFAFCDGHEYVIEVKERINQLGPDEKEKLLAGELVESSTPFSRSNRLDGILKDGRKQLDSTSAAATAFRVLWVHTDGIDSDLTVSRVRATFYGCVHVCRLSEGRPGDRSPWIQCLYFDYSTAYWMPSVVGLIIMDREGPQICLNEFSPDYARFKESSLVQFFRKHNAVADPVQLVESGEMIALHGDFPRKVENEVLAELGRQEGGRFTAVRMQQHAVSALVLSGCRSESTRHHSFE